MGKNDIGAALAAFGSGFLDAKQKKKAEQKDDKRWDAEFGLQLRRLEQSEMEYRANIEKAKREESAAIQEYGRKANDYLINKVVKDKLTGSDALQVTKNLYPGVEFPYSPEQLDQIGQSVSANVIGDKIAEAQALGTGQFAPEDAKPVNVPSSFDNALIKTVGMTRYLDIINNGGSITADEEQKVQSELAREEKKGGAGGGAGIATNENILKTVPFFGTIDSATMAFDAFKDGTADPLTRKVINDALTPGNSDWARFLAARDLTEGSDDEKTLAAQQLYTAPKDSRALYVAADSRYKAKAFASNVSEQEKMLNKLVGGWAEIDFSTGKPSLGPDGRIVMKQNAPPDIVIQVRKQEENTKGSIAQWANLQAENDKDMAELQKQRQRQQIKDSASAPDSPIAAGVGSLLTDAASTANSLGGIASKAFAPAKDVKDSLSGATNSILDVATRPAMNYGREAGQDLMGAFNFLNRPDSPGVLGLGAFKPQFDPTTAFNPTLLSPPNNPLAQWFPKSGAPNGPK